MAELWEGFLLGNAAILGNVCMLPLYPGMFALLAARSEREDAPPQRWLGAVVLAGVLTVIIGVAWVLTLLGEAFDTVLPVLLPLSFGFITVLGVMMLLGRNPLQRVGGAQAPVLGSPVASAFVYGLAIGPMTLPCTGPTVIAAFLLGSVAGSGELVDQLAYFLSFGLGFGWPLVALPLLTGSVQQRFTRFLTRNHRRVQVASGLLLIVVAAVGFTFDFLL